MESEKLRESLQRARSELDNLDKNISQIKEERDKLSAAQPKMKLVSFLTYCSASLVELIYFGW
jgi:flagellar biosynthesis chaperone FliJ